MAGKKRQTMGKIMRERERAEKRAAKLEKKEAKKAAAAAGVEWTRHEPGSFESDSLEPDSLEAGSLDVPEAADPENEPETGLTPPGDTRA